jgi:hypothetical protein
MACFEVYSVIFLDGLRNVKQIFALLASGPKRAPCASRMRHSVLLQVFIRYRLFQNIVTTYMGKETRTNYRHFPCFNFFSTLPSTLVTVSGTSAVQIWPGIFIISRKLWYRSVSFLLSLLILWDRRVRVGGEYLEKTVQYETRKRFIDTLW